MATKSVLDSRYGKLHLLAKNPRQIRDAAFNTLCESIQRDEDFLRIRPLIVWRVPDDYVAPEGDKNPFDGQAGELVILGGNQRARALKALGYDSVEDAWVVQARDKDGEWIEPDAAARLVLIDNGSIGIAGSNDYEKMLEAFNEITMRQSGIDFSEFTALMASKGGSEDPPFEEKTEEGEDISDEAEKDPVYGEKNPELEAFIAEREKTRNMLKEIDETGFHLLLCFPDGFEQKCEFVSKAKLFGGAVRLDGGPYLDLVFESYGQKMDFLAKSGIEDEDLETGVPPVLFGLFCDGRALAKKMGIRLAETGLHFRERIVDKQLAEMAMKPERQKSEEEVQEEIYAKLKAERKALGMDSRSKKGKQDKEDDVLVDDNL